MSQKTGKTRPGSILPEINYLSTWLEVSTAKVYALASIQPVLCLRCIPLCCVIHLTFILSAAMYVFHSPCYFLLVAKNTMG
jgi:hypothetical protein